MKKKLILRGHIDTVDFDILKSNIFGLACTVNVLEEDINVDVQPLEEHLDIDVQLDQKLDNSRLE